MDENTWRFAQLMMWLIGIQTALLTGILGAIWHRMGKLDERVQKVDDKLADVDKRVFAIEAMMHLRGGYNPQTDQYLKKAE